MKNILNIFKTSSLDKRKARSGYLFVLPFVLGILAIYLPILLDSIWLSFSTIIPGPGLPELEPVGMKYYREALITNETFKTKLLATLQDLLFQVPAILIFSLFIAVVLNQKMLGRAVFRAIYFVPVIIATGLMDSINVSDMVSTVTEAGIQTGAEMQQAGGFLDAMDIETLAATLPVGSELINIVITLINNVFEIINYSGVQMLIFLAGLQSISPAIYEACQIEGATAWETFWKVTFPMISPMILVNAFYTIIDAFTRSNSDVMVYINGLQDTSQKTAFAWVFFLIVFVIIAVIGGIMSTFIFYQRRD